MSRSNCHVDVFKGGRIVKASINFGFPSLHMRYSTLHIRPAQLQNWTLVSQNTLWKVLFIANPESCPVSSSYFSFSLAHLASLSPSISSCLSIISKFNPSLLSGIESSLGGSKWVFPLRAHIPSVRNFIFVLPTPRHPPWPTPPLPPTCPSPSYPPPLPLARGNPPSPESIIIIISILSFHWFHPLSGPVVYGLMASKCRWIPGKPLSWS